MRFRWLLPFLLSLSLLLAQQGAVLHALSHLPAQLPSHSHASDKQLPNNPACDKCAAYAALGAALGSKQFSIAAPPPAFLFVAALAAAFFAHPLRAYPARAPPLPDLNT